MDEIWGMNCDTGWETLTVHINRLRKRFEDWNEFEIVNVRGLGYKAVKRYETSFQIQKPAKSYKFTWFFIALVMLSMIITVTIELIVLLILQSSGAIQMDNIETWGLWPFIIFAVTSVVLGFGASAVVSTIPIRPVTDIVDGLNELSSGNYNARIDLGKHKSLKSIADAFNELAVELGNTEMLRSDFINNFSHEFKTPIVSISGFAKLLGDDSVSDAQRAEYLKIIVEEAGRLSDLATNVLNLSKVENMSILTEKKRYNVSEQIRNCLLLLEKNGRSKNSNSTWNSTITTSKRTKNS